MFRRDQRNAQADSLVRERGPQMLMQVCGLFLPHGDSGAGYAITYLRIGGLMIGE